MKEATVAPSSKGSESSRPTEQDKAEKWLASMRANASPSAKSIIDVTLADIGLQAMYAQRGLLESQLAYIESL
jgi:hypothetical protein